MKYVNAAEIRACAQAVMHWRERGLRHQDAGDHEAARSCFDLAKGVAREAFQLVYEQELVRTFSGLEAA